jgi:hypothetical protein
MIDAEQIYRKASTLDAGRLQTLADFLDFLLTREPGRSDIRPFLPTTSESPDVPGVAQAPALTPTSEVGQRLRAIRQRAIARGMPLQSVDEILAEVREGRAEAGDDQDIR